MWFADKLGPIPNAGPQRKVQNSKNLAPVRSAAPQPKNNARSQPVRAPEPPKKKKGWF